MNTCIERILHLIELYREKYQTGPGETFSVGEDAGWISQLIATLATSIPTASEWKRLEIPETAASVLAALEAEFAA